MSTAISIEVFINPVRILQRLDATYEDGRTGHIQFWRLSVSYKSDQVKGTAFIMTTSEYGILQAYSDPTADVWSTTSTWLRKQGVMLQIPYNFLVQDFHSLVDTICCLLIIAKFRWLNTKIRLSRFPRSNWHAKSWGRRSRCDFWRSWRFNQVRTE